MRSPEQARGIHGPKPKYCAECHAEVLREQRRVNAARQRERPEYRAYMRSYLAGYTPRRTSRQAPVQQRRNHVMHRYGLRPEHVLAWLAFQEGNCALCGEPLGRTYHIDHDHETGIVRGLLHPICNQQLVRLPNVAYLLGWVA